MRIPVFVVGLLALLAAHGAALAEPPPITAYGKMPALDMVRLSASGDKIAFIVADGDKRKLFVRKVGGEALVAGGIGEVKIRDLEWAGDDFVLITVTGTVHVGTGQLNKWRQEGRAELPFILIINAKTGKIYRMFADQQTAAFLGQAVGLGVRQLGGRWYEFVDIYDVVLGDRVYKVDLETGRGEAVPGFDAYRFDYLIGANGAFVARARYDEATRVWTLFSGEQGKRVVTERRNDLDTVDLGGLGRTDGTVVVTELTPTSFTVDEYPTTPGASPTRLFEGLDVEGFIHDTNTDLLIGALLPRRQGAVFFDPKLQRRYDAVRKAFPGYQVQLESHSADFGKMVVKTDGADDPGTYWLVDMSTGKAEDLMAAYPDVTPKDVGPTRMFKYVAADGLSLEGVLTLPPGSNGKALPLVMMPHGGPLDVYDKVGFDFWAQAFAARGYAVFQPNYRGSGGYGPAFRQAGFGQWGHKMLSDMSDGLQALAKAGVIDPKRVCIAGASYGGYAALAGVTIQHGLYRCAVDISGVSDVGAIMAGTRQNSQTAGGRYDQALFGADFAGNSALAAISPLRHAAEADAPILLIHGKDDTRVPYIHSESMAAVLTKAGKTVQFIPLDAEDHFWSREATRLQIVQESVAFVQKYNPATPPPSAVAAK